MGSDGDVVGIVVYDGRGGIAALDAVPGLTIPGSGSMMPSMQMMGS